MTAAAHLWDALCDGGMTFASGVPCSYLAPLLRAAEADPRVRYVPAPREDVAVGVASAASLAGAPGVALLQNSGLGNVVNTLTSFNLIYRIPVLLIVSWRGRDGGDAPEHRIMGQTTGRLLDLLQVPWQVLGRDTVEEHLARAREHMARGVPAALVIPDGVVT